MNQSSGPIAKRLLPILRELRKGTSNRQIAEATSLVPHTVEKYISELLTHFNCGRRGELIALLASGALDGELGEVSG